MRGRRFERPLTRPAPNTLVLRSNEEVITLEIGPDFENPNGCGSVETAVKERRTHWKFRIEAFPFYLERRPWAGATHSLTPEKSGNPENRGKDRIMNTTTKLSMMVATAALGGLIAGSTSRAATTSSTLPSSSQLSSAKKMVVEKAGTMGRTLDDTAKHDCKGKNDCKGKGGCKTGDAGCKGKNSCKGKGGCKTD